MKPKHLILTALIALSATFSIVALAQRLTPKSTQSMEASWKKVESFANKDMPESALKEVEAILAQAKKDNNSGQILKAMIYRMRFITDKNPDELIPLIQEFETETAKTTDPADQAVMYAMTAELYSNYYQSNKFTIDRRTDIAGSTPADIKEWTRSHFVNKVVVLSNLSFTNPDVLKNTDVQKYSAILGLGKDSRTIKPTLFDFISYKRIDLLENFTDLDSELQNIPVFYEDELGKVADSDKEETLIDDPANIIQRYIKNSYNDIIEFNKEQNNQPALIYAELQKLLFENPNRDENFLTKINELEKKYSDNDAVVEILAEKANYYLEYNTDSDEQKKNEKCRKTAFEITQIGINKYPNYKRIGLLKNIQSSILEKSLYAVSNAIVAPNSTLEIKVKSKNISQLKLSVYKINATALEYQKYKINDNRRYEKAPYPNRALVHTQLFSTPKTDNFDQVDTALTLKTGDYGIYEYTVEEPNNQKAESKTDCGFTVTDLAFFQRLGKDKSAKIIFNQEKTNTELYVVNRVSGKPLKDVAISIHNQKWSGSKYSLTFIEKITSSAAGKYLISTNRNQGNYIAFFERGNDKFFTSETQSYWYRDSSEPRTEVKISLFTDRSIYRPGQTVYYKGIAYYSEKNREEVAKNESFEVNLFNVNHEKVGTQQVKSNEFGSFAGSFVLPDAGLNGAYRMSVNGTSINLWVEEYKRPTFEVTIERPKDEIRFGEEVTVKGNVKAYAGYNMSDADVKYRVVRRPHYFWRWFEPDKIIATGTAKSDSEGNFTVKFTPVKDKKPTYNPWRKSDNDSYYTYFVYADVTDSKGETQQGEQSLSVGDKSLFILANISEKVEKDNPISLDITTQTLNGETVLSDVNYKIVRLENADIYYEKVNEKTEWKEGKTVLSGTLNTKDKLELNLKKTASGIYKIVLTTTDNRGNEVKTEDQFILYSKNDKRPPVKTYQWLTTANTELNVGEKATINFGTSTKNTSVLYELMHGKEVLESRWVEFDDEIKTFEIPFKESYGAGVTALFTFVKDEQFFTERVVISRKVEVKTLTPTVSVFRNKLKPGENAEWTIHIPEAAKDKKTAELLIGMYDASLDALRTHSWSFYPTYRERIPYSPAWQCDKIDDTDSDYARFINMGTINVSELMFDDFNWFGLTFNPKSYGRISIRGAGRISTASKEMVFAQSSVNIEEKEVVAMDMAMPMSEEAGFAMREEAVKTVEEKPKLQIRTNFNETAFFYPQLLTDENGNVKVSFTAPESLTRWNVKMLAHTQDLFFGQNEMQAITQKELMVQMNLPRFVRKSDKLTLVANVTNLSDTPLTPNVTLTIEDAPQPLKGGIVIAPKQTQTYSWDIPALKDFDLAVVRIVAETDNFSDGEQKYLPVLPDKVLVTESQTMTLRAGEERSFTFDNFIQNLKNVDTENFTVEYAGNPTWYAVQALPSVADMDGENAIDYLTGYYANTLGSYIANANPKLAATFEKWKNAGGSRDALLSNLEKNQELKNMLLEETPWVMSAKDETEQKRQIALLFDLNQTRNQANKYMEKLLKLQAPSGGFAWFEKMPESRYITQEILLNLARLDKMTKRNMLTTPYRKPLVSALEYLDLQIAKDFFELKKWNKNYQKQQTINNLQLFYLHTRSEYRDVPIHKSAEEAVKYYTAQSEKYWTNWTLYGRAMMATVAYRNSKTKLANEILTSIRENAMKTDELGMYWNANKAGWWWHERPIATQTAIMEAFSEIRQANNDVDEMKIWLLKQKQTQRWDTPISTLDAIYALLNYGTDWLSNQGDVVIKLGNTTLKPKEVEAGTAYIKETIPIESLKPEMGKITVTSKSTSGISWGAAYWQYYQDVDKVQAQGKEMKISKQLFVEKVTNQGKSMVPISQTTLQKGDKVITRLVVTTDRDLEFVALKDLRAACFEPVNQLSGINWKERIVYYQTTKDASTQFFFSYLPKGTYVFEYELWVNNSGTFSSGLASIQCHYAPEFVSHSSGEKVTVK